MCTILLIPQGKNAINTVKTFQETAPRHTRTCTFKVLVFIPVMLLYLCQKGLVLMTVNLKKKQMIMGAFFLCLQRDFLLL